MSDEDDNDGCGCGVVFLIIFLLCGGFGMCNHHSDKKEEEENPEVVFSFSQKSEHRDESAVSAQKERLQITLFENYAKLDSEGRLSVDCGGKLGVAGVKMNGELEVCDTDKKQWSVLTSKGMSKQEVAECFATRDVLEQRLKKLLDEDVPKALEKK